MYRIGEFARIAQVSPQTLRVYDRLGLLTPTRAENGYRFYLPEQLGLLNRILALKDLGLSLHEIGAALEEGLDEALLREKHAELRRRVHDDWRRLQRVERRLGTDPEVALKSAPAFRVASIRDELPGFDGLHRLHDELAEYLAGFGLTREVARPSLTVYHSPPGERVDVEAARTLPRDVPESERVRVRTLEPVPLMACAVHEGPYETLGCTFETVSEWLGRNGYSTIGPPRSVYLMPRASRLGDRSAVAGQPPLTLPLGQARSSLACLASSSPPHSQPHSRSR